MKNSIIIPDGNLVWGMPLLNFWLTKPVLGTTQWSIDVGGEQGIDLYINEFTVQKKKFDGLSKEEIEKSGIRWDLFHEVTNWRGLATELLIKIIAEIEKCGVIVQRVSVYYGVGGPNFILRYSNLWQLQKIQVVEIEEDIEVDKGGPKAEDSIEILKQL
ncbi:MAG: hypothetical protein AAB657_00060 [Patescibacteria group bacterium]